MLGGAMLVRKSTKRSMGDVEISPGKALYKLKVSKMNFQTVSEMKNGHDVETLSVIEVDLISIIVRICRPKKLELFDPKTQLKKESEEY